MTSNLWRARAKSDEDRNFSGPHKNPQGGRNTHERSGIEGDSNLNRFLPKDRVIQRNRKNKPGEKMNPENYDEAKPYLHKFTVKARSMLYVDFPFTTKIGGEKDELNVVVFTNGIPRPARTVDANNRFGMSMTHELQEGLGLIEFGCFKKTAPPSGAVTWQPNPLVHSGGSGNVVNATFDQGVLVSIQVL